MSEATGMREYVCGNCGEKNATDKTEAENIKEMVKSFGYVTPADRVEICDDCHVIMRESRIWILFAKCYEKAAQIIA